MTETRQPALTISLPYLCRGSYSIAAFFNKQGRGVVASRYGPCVSHLLLADDSLIFCKATQRQAQRLKTLLHRYESILGQCINYGKYGLFFRPNTSAADKSFFMNTFDVDECREVVLQPKKKALFSFSYSPSSFRFSIFSYSALSVRPIGLTQV